MSARRPTTCLATSRVFRDPTLDYMYTNVMEMSASFSDVAGGADGSAWVKAQILRATTTTSSDEARRFAASIFPTSFEPPLEHTATSPVAIHRYCVNSATVVPAVQVTARAFRQDRTNNQAMRREQACSKTELVVKGVQYCPQESRRRRSRPLRHRRRRRLHLHPFPAMLPTLQGYQSEHSRRHGIQTSGHW